MNIVRSPRPESGYTIIRNELLRDENLSYRARGVLTYILSNVDGWRSNVEDLAKRGKEAKTAIYTAMRELEDAGYLTRKKVRTAQGTFDWEITFYDVPTAGKHTPQNTTVHTESRADAAATEASRIVREIWEPAMKGKTAQPAITVVRITAEALRNGVRTEVVERALRELADNVETVSSWRLTDVINNKPAKGQLAADKKTNWSEVTSTSTINGEVPF